MLRGAEPSRAETIRIDPASFVAPCNGKAGYSVDIVIRLLSGQVRDRRSIPGRVKIFISSPKRPDQLWSLQFFIQSVSGHFHWEENSCSVKLSSVHCQGQRMIAAIIHSPIHDLVRRDKSAVLRLRHISCLAMR